MLFVSDLNSVTLSQQLFLTAPLLCPCLTLSTLFIPHFPFLFFLSCHFFLHSLVKHRHSLASVSVIYAGSLRLALSLDRQTEKWRDRKYYFYLPYATIPLRGRLVIQQLLLDCAAGIFETRRKSHVNPQRHQSHNTSLIFQKDLTQMESKCGLFLHRSTKWSYDICSRLTGLLINADDSAITWPAAEISGF